MAIELENGQTLYSILGIQPTATPLEITTAYRRQALLYHPDKLHQQQQNGRPMNETDRQAMFEKIKYAYDILKDPKSRLLYDKYGQLALTLIQNTGSVETAATLLNPVRSVLAMAVIFLVSSFVFGVPFLIQMRLDGWIYTSWWLVLAPLLAVSSLLLLVSFLSFLVTLVMGPSRPEDSFDAAPPSKWAALAGIFVAMCALAAFITQIVFLASAFSKAEAPEPIALMLVFEPWCAFEIFYVLFKSVVAFLMFREKKAHGFLAYIRLFRWSALRSCLLAMLLLHLTAPSQWTPHLVIAPLYLGCAVSAVDAWAASPWLSLTTVYPLFTVFLLHAKIGWNAVRWFSVFAPTYALLAIPVVLSLLSMPAILIWHRSLVQQQQKSHSSSQEDIHSTNWKVFQPGQALGPRQSRLEGPKK